MQLCNYVCLVGCHVNHYAPVDEYLRLIRITTSGDDSVISIDDVFGYFKTSEAADKLLDQVAATCHGIFGVTISIKKSRTTHTFISADTPVKDGVNFLSHFWTCTWLPSAEIKRVATLLLIPEKNKMNAGWELSRCVSYYITGVFDSSVQNMLEMYYRWLRDRVRENNSIKWDAKVFKDCLYSIRYYSKYIDGFFINLPDYTWCRNLVRYGCLYPVPPNILRDSRYASIFLEGYPVPCGPSSKTSGCYESPVPPEDG